MFDSKKTLRERGSILLLTGFALIVLFGFVGLAVDVGRVYAARAALNRAVDAAALAGVLEFNGTAAGLTSAQTKAAAYVVNNEPSATAPASCADPGVCADSSSNKLTVNATKNVSMIFLRVLGISSATVHAHAAAGFDVGFLDAVTVIDTTPSMAGSPISNAKTAAINFKDTLLGTTPSGNVLVGVAPFRGCYKPSPLASSSSTSDCIDTSLVASLSYNSSSLTTAINNLSAGSGSSGTNVCTGLVKGWGVLNGTGNHWGQTNARRFMILLSDGDNYYPGEYTYQTSPTTSPDAVTIGATSYNCQPYNSCSSPWTGTPCTIGTDGTVTPGSGTCSGCEDDGYLNGNDGSNPQTCNETPTPRERQVDVKTLTLARALKAQGVEIFVVAFTVSTIPGCNLGNTTVYNDGDATECNTVNQTSIGAGPGGSSANGPIGDTTSDTSANHRLLKCMASSTDETLDHYYYAATASDLPTIFATIAAQISHRLVE